MSFLPAPCPPTNLTVRADCGTNLGTLTWAPSIHAISYTATVTGTHGHVASCSSNTTTCSVKLDCGRQYSAVVIASTATCNSSAGASLTFDSGKRCLLLPADVWVALSIFLFGLKLKTNKRMTQSSSPLAPSHSSLSA